MKFWASSLAEKLPSTSSFTETPISFLSISHPQPSLVPRLLCMGREKKTLVHNVCAYSVLEISVKSLHYTNLQETCRLFSHVRCLPLTTLCVDNDEGAIKPISCSLTRIVMCPSIPAESYGTWSFPLKTTDCVEWSNADSWHQSDIVSDFKTADGVT